MMYCSGDSSVPASPAAMPAPSDRPLAGVSLWWPVGIVAGLMLLSAFGPPAVKRYAYRQRYKRWT